MDLFSLQGKFAFKQCWLVNKNTNSINAIDKDSAVALKALDDKINQTIAVLDGAVFPKLNWSSPKVYHVALLGFNLFDTGCSMDYTDSKSSLYNCFWNLSTL